MPSEGIISRLELLELMKTNNFLLIDVRTPSEVASGKIVNSHNIPLNALSEALSMSNNNFKQNFGFTKPSKTDKLVFYCRSGARAQSATQIAKNAGYSNVLNYQGSWNEWSSYLNEAN
jgi:rhodanese-related sulfurtransferase